MSAKNLSRDELETWQRLQTVTELLRREVGRGLQADADVSAAEFTVLAHLAQAGGSARPTACARSIGWDSSRLAHQLRRLERRGLLERRPAKAKARPAADGRGSEIVLNDAGRRAHRLAVGPHLRAAKRWFADALTDTQLHALDDVLTTLARHADRLTTEEAS